MIFHVINHSNPTNYRYSLIVWQVLACFVLYQHEKRGDLELKLCLKCTSLSKRSRCDSRELCRCSWGTPCDVEACCCWGCWWKWMFWCRRSCFNLVNSTVTQGIWTNWRGVLLSLSACTKFKTWNLINNFH